MCFSYVDRTLVFFFPVYIYLFFFLLSLGKIMSFSVISKGMSNLKIKNKSSLRGNELRSSLGQVHFFLKQEGRQPVSKTSIHSLACLVEMKCSQDPRNDQVEWLRSTVFPPSSAKWTNHQFDYFCWDNSWGIVNTKFSKQAQRVTKARRLQSQNHILHSPQNSKIRFRLNHWGTITKLTKNRNHTRHSFFSWHLMPLFMLCFVSLMFINI